MEFPKPTFNVAEQRQFIPSPVAPGGNRATRRKKNKQLPKVLRRGGIVYSNTASKQENDHAHTM